MIKILALDMDGTLLNSKKEIPQANIELCTERLKKESNWFFAQVAPWSASNLIMAS